MMLPLSLGPVRDRGHELLCLGAHSDDLEIGCGGTVLRLLGELPIARVTWVVLSGADTRADEAKQAADCILGGHPGAHIVQAGFRDGFFPHDPVPLKEYFEELKRTVRPDLILTHYRHDAHQDHRMVAELTYNSFRDHLILEYEVMKIDGDLGNPNVYVALDPATVDSKIRVLEECYGSQRDKRWFDGEAFRSLMRLRGIEAGTASGYAEAFYGRKVVL
jgi:LmbE family N-acetylglucosaminyl deacetylase